MPAPAADEIRQLLVHPAVWPHLESWLAARHISVSPLPLEGDDLPTYVMSPDLERSEPTTDHLAAYTRILKQLPRQAVAELVAAVTTDPELHGRRTAIAQASMLVSVGHRMGWADAEAAS